jgi:lauroyl/myristoyl acyltransferase
VPRRLWVPCSHALSLGIALARPGVTRRRIARLRRSLGAEPTDRQLFDLRWRIMSTYMDERLEILREYRPGGWRPELRFKGREHLDRALARGRGAVLMVSPFSYADLVSKKALDAEGLRASHLSAFSRGFSPNSCHVWEPSRFGMSVLSRLRTRVEDRYLRERIVVPRTGSLAYARQMEHRLRENGIVSMRMGDVGHRALELPLLGGHIRLATGGPSLAVTHGAALLPLFVVRTGRSRFDVVVEPELAPMPDLDRRAAVEDLLTRYVALLEDYVRRNPYLWSGWYRLRMEDA